MGRHHRFISLTHKLIACCSLVSSLGLRQGRILDDFAKLLNQSSGVFGGTVEANSAAGSW
jgi:hypothetical protein